MGTPFVLDAVNYAKFVYGIPSQTRPYASELWDAGREFGVDPFILAGIMERESISGAALYPRGPGGTGDWTARPSSLRADGKHWLISQHGKIVTSLPQTRNEKGELLWRPHPTEPRGPYYIPTDEKGWGRGLMQIDWAIHNAWLRANDWTSPRVMIRKAAAVMAENTRMMAKAGLKGSLLTHAATSGYNLTPAVALRYALDGKNPDTKTTGGDYAFDTSGRGMGVLNRAERFRKASGIA